MAKMRLILFVSTLVTQRAARQMTGYHCGYTFKGQKTSKGTLDRAITSLTFFEQSLEEKTEAQQHRRAVIRTAADFYHNTTQRPSTEEFCLAMQNSGHDVRSAEFIRTFFSSDFYGRCLVNRYGLERKNAGMAIEVPKAIPL